MKKVWMAALAVVFVFGLTGIVAAQKVAQKEPAKQEQKPEQIPGKGVPEADRKFLTEAAKGGMFEVEMGKVAAEKASSDEVKKFGQRMVDDHSKANDELKHLAANKGVTVPQELDKKHKDKIDKLSKLSGAQFDRAYMNDMVKDHKKDVSDFRKAAKDGKDPDVKSFASKTLAVLEEHLKMAQELSKKVGGGRAPEKK